MLSVDLAELYGVAVKGLNQAVRRNLNRFPEDFMFQLTQEEFKLGRDPSGYALCFYGARYRDAFRRPEKPESYQRQH
jgi:hypothetical protein